MKALRKKRQVASLAAFLLACGIVLLGGCSGGMFGNLVPLPKILSGSVHDNVYYAKNDLFSVSTPFPQGSNDYTYASIKEQYEDGHAFVVFHSSTAGDEYYHVEVDRLPAGSGGSVNLEAAANNAAGNIQKMQSRAGRKPFVLVKEETWKAKYTTGLIQLYTQKVPAASIESNSKRKFFTAYILMYVTEGSGKLAAVVVDWVAGADEFSPPKKMAVEGADSDPIQKAFAQNARAWEFINSINLNVTAPVKK